MYNNPYYYQQSNIEKLNSQIAELEKMKAQMTQPTPITQNFQIAANTGMRYANTIDEVNKEIVIADTPFFSKDLSVMWLKNNKGEVKTYELNEIVEKDEKDLKIEFLQAQINEMKGMIKNVNEYVDDAVEDEKPSNVSISKPSTKKPKQSAGIVKSSYEEL